MTCTFDTNILVYTLKHPSQEATKPATSVN